MRSLAPVYLKKTNCPTNESLRSVADDPSPYYLFLYNIGTIICHCNNHYSTDTSTFGEILLLDNILQYVCLL